MRRDPPEPPEPPEPSEWKVRERRRLTANLSLLPNLLTVGNGICGFAAIVKLSLVRIDPATGVFENPENFTFAAALILLGMVFDVFDGKVARMAGSSSELGAQLDSLCDLVTFGVTPAFAIIRLHVGAQAPWINIVYLFSLAYFLGALLRLARFNVENSPDESAHECFKGMPSPGAAGCVASLIIFERYLFKFEAAELVWISKWWPAMTQASVRVVADGISYALPFLALVLGFSMVSNRLRFEHVGSRLFQRSQSFDVLAYLVFGAILTAIMPELVLPLGFLGYLVWTPTVTTLRWIFRRGSADAAPEDSENEPTE